MLYAPLVDELEQLRTKYARLDVQWERLAGDLETRIVKLEARQAPADIESAPAIPSGPNLPFVKITRDALGRLPEYSSTLPTGVHHGKSWKRNLNRKSGEAVWIVGSYRVEGDGTVFVDWATPEIVPA